MKVHFFHTKNQKFFQAEALPKGGSEAVLNKTAVLKPSSW